MSACISVVIPCYNESRFLRKAIDSALNQVDGTPEVVLVNDGSIDQLHAIMDRYGYR
jgi:glycosyltransferase involved in cell wall biosynthesis